MQGQILEVTEQLIQRMLSKDKTLADEVNTKLERLDKVLKYFIYCTIRMLNSVVSICRIKLNIEQAQGPRRHRPFCIISRSLKPLLKLFMPLCLSLIKSQRNSLSHAYNSSFVKVYSTFSKEIITQCQFYSGYLSFSNSFDMRKSNFLRTLSQSEGSFC